MLNQSHYENVAKIFSLLHVKFILRHFYSVTNIQTDIHSVSRKTLAHAEGIFDALTFFA